MKFKFELVVAQNSPNVIISWITRFSKVYKSIWNWTDLWLSGVTRFQRFIKIFGIEQICKVIPFKMRNLPEFESRVRFIVIFLFSFCSSWKLNLFSQTGWKFYLERQRDIVANDWNKCLNARECIPKELMPVDILYSGISGYIPLERMIYCTYFCPLHCGLQTSWKVYLWRRGEI